MRWIEEISEISSLMRNFLRSFNSQFKLQRFVITKDEVKFYIIQIKSKTCETYMWIYINFYHCWWIVSCMWHLKCLNYRFAETDIHCIHMTGFSRHENTWLRFNRFNYEVIKDKIKTHQHQISIFIAFVSHNSSLYLANLQKSWICG